MTFSSRAAKALQPGEHIILPEFPGLRLEASASRKSWIYRFKSPVDGRMRQKKLGEWPAMAYGAAIAAWEPIRARRDAGEDPVLAKKQAAAPSPHPGVYTVKDLCLDFIAGYIERHRQPLGADQVRRRLLGKIGPIADLPAAALTRKQAFDLLQGQAHAPRNAADLRSELAAAWDYALDADRIPDDTPNWWRQVMSGKLKSKGRQVAGQLVTTKRVLSESELSILLPWLSNFSEAISDVLTLYLWTALRGGEIVSMEGKELSEEPDGLWWTIPKSKTKNRSRKNAIDHRVPVVGRAEQIIRKRAAIYGNGYLFPDGKKSHILQRIIQQTVWTHQPYAKAPDAPVEPILPVVHWAPHDLRRTARTLLAALGCPREAGEAIIGHMLPGVEGLYNRHKYDAEKRVWLTRLSEHLEGLLQNPILAAAGLK